MAIYDIPVKTLSGEESSLGSPASRSCSASSAAYCGVSPHLEATFTTSRGRGFSVVGFPCNQFGGQEPGTAEEIADFCSKTYNFEKFLLGPEGTVVARFRPRTGPDDPEVLAVIERHLPS